MPPITRSQKRDALARDVFEAPPVLEVILHHLQYENDTISFTNQELDLVSLQLVFKSPVVRDVIHHHKIRLLQMCFKSRMFLQYWDDTVDLLKRTHHPMERRVIFMNLLNEAIDNIDILQNNLFLKDHYTVLLELIDDLNKECPVFRQHGSTFKTRLSAFSF